MTKLKEYIALDKGQTPDGIWHMAGERFKSSAPVGAWMAEIDGDGNPIPKVAEQASYIDPIIGVRRELADAVKERDQLLAENEKLKADLAKK